MYRIYPNISADCCGRMRTQVFYKVKLPIFGIRYHVNQAILEKKELVVPGGPLKRFT